LNVETQLTQGKNMVDMTPSRCYVEMTYISISMVLRINRSNHLAHAKRLKNRNKKHW
jgi:hypothetical protein